jgi:CubicO group peptidase (beta-lactamase class C family)
VWRSIQPQVAGICAALALTLTACTNAPVTQTMSPPPPAPASPSSLSLPADRVTALDAELTAVLNDPERPLASLSVLAIKHGEVIYQNQFGNRHIDSARPTANVPANADTLYRIASISKLVTTIGVMRLVEAGTLSLDADVSLYLGWSLRNPHFPDAPITLRQLLSHTSSLRDDGGYYWEYTTALKDVLTPGGRLYGKGAMWATNAGPGQYFQYANLPWGVIGTVMERATGERFDRLMQRLVLTPLNLHGGFHPADFSAADLANTATLYRKRKEMNGREIWDPSPATGAWIAQVDDYQTEVPLPRAKTDYVIGSNGTVFGPQGACRLSAAGLAKLMRLLMRNGQVDGVRLLEPESVTQMLSTQWRFNTANPNGGTSEFGNAHQLFNEWGLGNQHFLDVSGPQRGDRLVEGGDFTGVGHLGDAWGLTAAFVFDPKTNDGVIFLVGGVGANPENARGNYSAFYRYEERILTALIRRALSR